MPYRPGRTNPWRYDEGGTDGSQSDFQNCGGRHPGVGDLPGAKAQWTGRAGIFDQPCRVDLGAVLDGALYI